MEKKIAVNPYEVLGISSAASTGEITKAFTLAMKRREYSADIIAKARKSLMNQEERIVADYLRPILPTPQRFKHQDFSSFKASTAKLELASEFDNLEQTIAQVSQEGCEIDKKIGKKFS